MVRLTELVSNQGTIVKKYTIKEDGTFTVKSAPTVHSAVAKPLDLQFEEVAPYLDSLTSSLDRCIVLGTCGSPGQEIPLTTADKVSDGTIARTQNYFKWANGGSVSLCLLDFDAEHSMETRKRVIAELEAVLSPAIISTKGQDSLCRWLRPSTSSSARINGVTGNGLHVFIPVKKASAELVKLIHRWMWLTDEQYRGHKILKTGSVVAASPIDPAVGSAERIVYSGDADVDGEGKEKFYTHVDRTCEYIPGGVLDAEIAIAILSELTTEFQSSWSLYKKRIEASEEVKQVKNAWKAEQTAKLIAEGTPRKAAAEIVDGYTNLVLLSNSVLIRSNGDKVLVKEILSDPDSWIGQDRFTDPIKGTAGRNVGKILGTLEDGLILHSFSGGGTIYKLLWNYADLEDWVKNASLDELEDLWKIRFAQSSMESTQLTRISKKLAKKLESSVADIKDDLKDATPENHANVDKSEDAPEMLSMLPVSATHADIVKEYLSLSGDCRGYGDGVYVWKPGATIWAKKSKGTIESQLMDGWNHVTTCKRSGDYSVIAKTIIGYEPINVVEWKQAYGIPCSNGFYKVDRDGIRLVDYSKELGCRFKIGMAPSFDMKTPMFNELRANVDNDVLFQQLFGLTLSGYLRELQKVFVQFGRGGSGKGTVNEILSALLPRERLTNVGLSQMNDDKSRMFLIDSAVNIVPETEVSDKPIGLAGLKSLTGGDLNSAWQLYKGMVFFTPSCTHILSLNDWPALESTGEEVRRRVGETIVRFERNHGEAIPGFAQLIIKNELPGVLAYAIEGVRSFFEYGLRSETSKDHFASWISAFDPISLFLNQHVMFTNPRDPGILRSEMWQQFKEFSEDSGYRLMKKGKFFASLASHPKIGEPRKTDGRERFRGTCWRK
jgi:hypothetical protein